MESKLNNIAVWMIDRWTFDAELGTFSLLLYIYIYFVPFCPSTSLAVQAKGTLWDEVYTIFCTRGKCPLVKSGIVENGKLLREEVKK